MKTIRAGLYLKKMRMDHGFTLHELARKMKVSPQYLSSIECGRAAVTTGVVQRVSDYLELDFDTIKRLLTSDFKKHLEENLH